MKWTILNTLICPQSGIAFSAISSLRFLKFIMWCTTRRSGKNYVSDHRALTMPVASGLTPVFTSPFARLSVARIIFPAVNPGVSQSTPPVRHRRRDVISPAGRPVEAGRLRSRPARGCLAAGPHWRETHCTFRPPPQSIACLPVHPSCSYALHNRRGADRRRHAPASGARAKTAILQTGVEQRVDSPGVVAGRGPAGAPHADHHRIGLRLA